MGKIDVPRARAEPSPAKTKMKVERSSAKVALMESGWVASSALPNTYARAGAGIFRVCRRKLSDFALPLRGRKTIQASEGLRKMEMVEKVNKTEDEGEEGRKVMRRGLCMGEKWRVGSA